MACGQPAAPLDPIDLLVINARVVDGTGAPAREGAVAVHAGHVTAVLEPSAAAAAAARASRVIDAGGRVVAPGFIDLHSHSDLPLVIDGHAQSKIRQGVTTEVIGESGSVAPQKAPTEDQPWTDFNGYFAVLEKQGIAVNLLSYVGLGTVRELVVGNDNRPPTPAEMTAMQKVVTAAMQQGAAGVSTGLIYPPNAFATLDELVALSTPAAALGGRYASHLRHDGKRLREGIEEAIAIGERAKLPAHVFHVKVTGQQNFGRMKEIVALVEAARARGVQVTADIYPYVASSTSLTATLPQWVLDGGPDALVKNLSDRRTRARVRRDMEDANAAWDNRYQSAGTWANVQLASIGRGARRRRRDRRCRQPQVRGHARGRCGQAGRQRPVRLRLRPVGRDPRQRRLRLLHHGGGRREAGAGAALGGHRLRRLGPRHRGTAAHGRAAPAQLRHLPAGARQVRARGESAAARGSGAQDDVAGRVDRAAARPRHRSPRANGPTS